MSHTVLPDLQLAVDEQAELKLGDGPGLAGKVSINGVPKWMVDLMDNPSTNG